MKMVIVVVMACGALGGCAGNFETLAKCSADENPVPAMAYVAEDKGIIAADNAMMTFAGEDDCGPMRPVNRF